jgi:four helix bundle protein
MRSKNSFAETGCGFSRSCCSDLFSLALTLAPALTLRPDQHSFMPQFDHEKLTVYQAATKFVAWSTELISEIWSKPAVKDQLDRASTSVPLNIAQGNGKFAVKDPCRFLDFDRGSALECAACPDVIVAKNFLTKQQSSQAKASCGRLFPCSWA